MMIYGPVPSWRLKKSLGIDIISIGKYCSFDCTYCQLGKTEHKTINRTTFCPTTQLETELKTIGKVDADVVTFSGMGESTLATNLGKAVDIVKSLSLPTAILTNSSFLTNPDVLDDLHKIDYIHAKLDAADNAIFKAVNRPHPSLSFDDILDGIHEVKIHTKHLILQMMFVAENKDSAKEMAQLAKEIQPEEVHINTPLRYCPVPPLSKEDITTIESFFNGIPTKSVYTSTKPHTTPINEEEVKKRRK